MSDGSGVEKEVLPQNRLLNLKKFFFVSGYMLIIPTFLLFVVLYSLTVKYQGNGYISRQLHKPQFQAVPEDAELSAINFESEDGRQKALDDFFARYDSPLEGYAKTIIDEADKHSIDYRLLPAIAMQESTLCKKIIKDSHNCWGFGIYGGKVTKFPDYESAIRTVTETLAKKYVQKGFENPEQIVSKYTPSDTGRWAEVVTLIMSRLKDSI